MRKLHVSDPALNVNTNPDFSTSLDGVDDDHEVVETRVNEWVEAPMRKEIGKYQISRH